MKKPSGRWKKERTTGRKYSHSDAHKEPPTHTRKKYWVSDFDRKSGQHVAGHWSKNPTYKRK